jgi:hypothetical protein
MKDKLHVVLASRSCLAAQHDSSKHTKDHTPVVEVLFVYNSKLKALVHTKKSFIRSAISGLYTQCAARCLPSLGVFLS